MDDQNLIEKAAEYVESKLSTSDEGGHDWHHTKRVWNVTKYLTEANNCNKTIAELGALFHDIADAKFHNGDETVGEKITQNWLQKNKVNLDIVERVVFIVNHVSFRKKYKPNLKNELELAIVQDADRLDAIGAIGIARAFSFGGYKNRPLYSTTNQTNSTIDHFYDKLLLLSSQMNTEAARKIAIEKHNFMKAFLDQFNKETNLENHSL